MQVSLSGHHVEITDSMRAYVDGKIGRLERHFDQALDIHIVLTVEKLRHRAEATLHVSGGNLHETNFGYALVIRLDLHTLLLTTIENFQVFINPRNRSRIPLFGQQLRRVSQAHRLRKWRVRVVYIRPRN